MKNLGEQIGLGAEKGVFRHARREDRVVAIYEHPVLPQESKSILYLNRLARLLLPASSIHIHASGIGPDGKAFQESTYIPHDTDHRIVQEAATGKRKFDDSEVWAARERVLAFKRTKPFQDFLARAREKGLFFEPSVINYIQNPDGSLTYVDFGPAFVADLTKDDVLTGDVRLNFDLEKIEQAIAGLQEPERTEAEGSLRRILELAEEVKLLAKTQMP